MPRRVHVDSRSSFPSLSSSQKSLSDGGEKLGSASGSGGGVPLETMKGGFSPVSADRGGFFDRLPAHISSFCAQVRRATSSGIRQGCETVTEFTPRFYYCVLFAGMELGHLPLLISGIWQALFLLPPVFINTESDSGKVLMKSLERLKEKYGHNVCRGGVVPQQVYSHIMDLRYSGLGETLRQESLSNQTYERQFYSHFVTKLTPRPMEGKSLRTEVGSRLGFLALAIGAVFGRAIFGVVGVFAALGSFVYPDEKLAQIAYEGLGALLIGRDITFCAIKIINPRAFVTKAGPCVPTLQKEKVA